jgi:hypothetical protein
VAPGVQGEDVGDPAEALGEQPVLGKRSAGDVP